MQFYTAYRFYQLAVATGWREWQVPTSGFLFGLIATGNISTTLYTVIQKRRKSNALRVRTRTFSGALGKSR